MALSDITPTDRTLAEIIRAGFPPDGSPAGRGVSVTDWRTLAMNAGKKGLAPLLFDAVKRLGKRADVPAETFEQLRITYLRTLLRNEEIYRNLGTVLVACEHEQIPVVLLKGCALALTVYESLAHRPMCDIDIMVPRATAARAGDVLTGLGYAARRRFAMDFNSEFWCEQCFMNTKGGYSVDLHTHVFTPACFRMRAPVEWFWHRTGEIACNGNRVLILSPEAQLLHLTAHFFLHESDENVYLRWSYDIARLLARYGPGMAWDEVGEAARTFGLAQSLRVMLAHVAEVWGVDVPAGVRIPAAATREGLPFAVLRAHAPFAMYMVNFTGARSVKGRLSFVMKTLFPGTDFLRARYRMRDPRFATCYYARHLAIAIRALPRLLWGITRSVLRLLRKDSPR